MSSAKAREEEARNILARANKNQADDGPSTRKAAIWAYRYLHIMATQHGVLIQQAYVAAKTHAARSKGPIDPKDTAGYHPLPDELPTVPPELTSGLLHCLSTLNPGEIGHHQETPRNSSNHALGHQCSFSGPIGLRLKYPYFNHRSPTYVRTPRNN